MSEQVVVQFNPPFCAGCNGLKRFANVCVYSSMCNCISLFCCCFKSFVPFYDYGCAVDLCISPVVPSRCTSSCFLMRECFGTFPRICIIPFVMLCECICMFPIIRGCIVVYINIFPVKVYTCIISYPLVRGYQDVYVRVCFMLFALKGMCVCLYPIILEYGVMQIYVFTVIVCA